MLRYAARRLLELIPTTLGILLLAFVLFNVVVGSSPALTILGKGADERSIAAFNKRYGYDKPLIVGKWGSVEGEKAWKGLLDSQFCSFVKGVATGDLGYSTKMNEPVKDVLKRGVGPSLSLTVPILVAGTLFALALAMLSAAFRGGAVDKTILFFSAALMSVNYVIWVLLGQFLLAFKAGWFPIWGYGGAMYLALPVIIGIVSSLGMDVRFFRTAILDELFKPYVLTARSKGLSRVVIMTRHVLRNALIPIVTYISLSIPYLFTGSLLLESFFGIPGLGSVSINAIQSGDLAVVRALVVFGALVYQVVNLATDLLYAVLDPRIRLSK
ncbi:MAG: ABC transporter permease [Kiritimatiellae bacterium]|nr:ABC transporter permease [Kiritimatiellia bacterium]